MAKRRRRGLRAMPPLAMPPMEDMDGIFGFLDGPFFDPFIMKESAMLAAGGAAATVAIGMAKNFIGGYIPITNENIKNALLVAGIGFLGSRLLWDKQPALAKGAMGATGALLARNLLSGFGIPVAGMFGDDPDPASALLAAPEEELLGLGDAFVEERRGLLMGSEVDVSEPSETELSWLA
jgi:hypothetical protein